MSGVERGDCHRGEVVWVLNIVSISMLGLGVGADLRSKVRELNEVLLCSRFVVVRFVSCCSFISGGEHDVFFCCYGNNVFFWYVECHRKATRDRSVEQPGKVPNTSLNQPW
jgi:hypothetical protein